MQLSLQVQYAICGVFDLAYSGDGQQVQVRVIGERQQIPTRYLEQIFQRLRKAGLVISKRGPGGGYVLARPPAEVSLRDIVEAVEGEVRLASPSEAAEATHRPSFLWPELESQLSGVLADTTIADLCSRAAREAVPRDSAEAFVYQI
jgi:Rrf2 family iron-sulfur cluster assembly transcriptional regulator